MSKHIKSCKKFCESSSDSSSSDSECEQKSVKPCKKQWNKCKKVDPIVGTWVDQNTLVAPAPPVVLYGALVYSKDGTLIAQNTAGLGQLSSILPPNYIDSVFVGHWEKVGKNKYHAFFTWVENDLTGATWPTVPSQRRACYQTLTISNGNTLTGTSNVFKYNLNDINLANPTPLVSETTLKVKANVNPSLFPII